MRTGVEHWAGILQGAPIETRNCGADRYRTGLTIHTSRVLLMDELQNAMASIRALLSAGARSEAFVPLVRVLATSYGNVVAPVFDAGIRLYRATRYHRDLPTTKMDLWFPPAARAKAGRANFDGQPMFYCSVHQSPALAEIEAGPYSVVVVSEWVTQDRMILQDLGFEEQAFRRFTADRQRQPHQIEDVANASNTALEARRFVSEAFLAEGPTNYALTAAITHVFTDGDAFAGVRYPSLAFDGRADNVALRPEYVQKKMRLEAAVYFHINSVSDGSYGFDPIADLTGIGESGLLSWTYRDRITMIPPSGAVVAVVKPGERWTLQVREPSDIVIENRRYTVAPGSYLEGLTDGVVVKLSDGTVIVSVEVSEPPPITASGKNPAALAQEANGRLRGFQNFIAIVVRSREIAGRRVSVAAAVTLANLNLDPPPWSCQLAKQSAFEFHDPHGPPEPIAWWKYVNAIRESSIGLPALAIVEGGVETVAAINARLQPLIGNEFLPDGFTLACSRAADGPTDIVTSKAMSECVKDAMELLDWLATHPDCPAQTFEDSECYSRMRVWPRRAMG